MASSSPRSETLRSDSGGIEVGRDLLDQAGPLGPELAKGIDAGIFDESIGLDRDAADGLLEEDPANKAVVGVVAVLPPPTLTGLFWAWTGEATPARWPRQIRALPSAKP